MFGVIMLISRFAQLQYFILSTIFLGIWKVYQFVWYD